MALHEHSLQIIADLIFVNKCKKLMFLSYPDLICNPKSIDRMFGTHDKALKIREDSKEIIKFHKAHDIAPYIIETKDLFEQLGCECTFVDIVNARGFEEICDLNLPINSKYHYKYDLIIDCALDHCFNIGEAFKNVLYMPRLMGYILHIHPLLMINHGFYCFNPCLYQELYVNTLKWEICKYLAFKGIKKIEERYNFVNLTNRIKNIDHDSMQIILAQKVTYSNVDCEWPIQTIFKQNPNLITH